MGDVTMKNYDAHVVQRNFIKDGFVMFTRKVYPNTWTFTGNYRPSLCKALMNKMPNAFAY